MKNSRDETEAVLDALRHHYAGQLTPWEMDFLESVTDQHDAGRALTEKQRAKLDQIFGRVSHGGHDGGSSA